MKKFITLAFALFFAVAAAAQNYASQKINQIVVTENLEQTVFAGDEIELVKIVYENTGIGENESPENEGTTDFLKNFGLSKIWTKGPACIISGKMRGDIDAGTYKAYIVVHDDEGKLFTTELTFIVKEKPFSLEWDKSSGSMDQTVNAGAAIDSIVFNYKGIIKSYSVSGLPSGLSYDIVQNDHKIIIGGTVNAEEMSDVYEYKVSVTNDLGAEIIEMGTITVNDSKARTSIKVYENEKQKVVAGNEIKPVVFKFANVHLDENLSSFKDEGSLKGTFKYSVEDNKLTVSGTVYENLENGTYLITIIAMGKNNNDTAFATVEVSHKFVVTTVSVIENETQTLTAGDSIKPIVFQYEHGSDPEITNFPGGYELRKNGNTVTIVGLIEEKSKGPYDVVLSVTGVDNNASAKATINVIPATMTFDLVEGSDNQTVVAGQDIIPIVYQYNHVKHIGGKGIPANLKMDQDQEKKQVKIYGTVDSKSATHEYAYTFELTDFYDKMMTVTGRVNVVASIADISSSSNTSAKSSNSEKSSSSSVAWSSSSNDVKTSSSVATSSSSTNPNSSTGSSSINIVVANNVKVGYANNELIIMQPSSSIVRVQIFDLTGHLVESFAKSVIGSKNFSLSHLNKGSYLICIECNNQTRIVRVVVK